jgi:Ca2+-transporting ATPase
MGGLSKEEAQRVLQQVGYNELAEKKERGVFAFLATVFSEPMFFLLLGAAGLYVLLGNYKEGLVLSLAMVLIIAITFFQKQKSSRALAALKKLSSPRALVLRDNRPERIAGKEVVPGDWLILSAGDRVAADATLLESSGLHADESLLSGESAAVHKDLLGDKRLFAGSLIVSGKGVAVVSATGGLSLLGKIGGSVQAIVPRKTGLQLASALLTRRLLWVGLFLSVMVVLAFYLTRGGFLNALLTGLSASMAILPEEFPVVLTVFFAIGAWRISQSNVLTRNPSAIESLGAATVLCADKTGTITQNKMELALLYNGSDWLERSSFNDRPPSFNELVYVSRQASEATSVDPMDSAIINFFNSWSGGDFALSLVKEYPLQDDLLAVTRVLDAGKGGALVVAAKGAPETIFRLCGLSKEKEAATVQALHTMAERGFRVLGVAKASVENGGGFPSHQAGFSFSFVGLLGFEDPVRPEMTEAMNSCRSAGVRVVMITGDHPATAKQIAEQIGLGDGRVVTGGEIALLDDSSLAALVKKEKVFARILPDQKLRLVRAFHVNGEVVAMMGDGVNDAPALKAADIGVAMGRRGTDVAREAADLVLLDDNFYSVVGAIALGRRIYDNLQKAMLYILSIHVPIVGLVLVPALWPSLPILMLPVQIVFLELIIDPVCSVAFESQPAESGVMMRPPRKKEALFFSHHFFKASALHGLLLFLIVLCVYIYCLSAGQSEPASRGAAFATLVLGNLFLISSLLSFSEPFFASFFKNRVAILFISAALLLLLLIFSIPFLRELFRVAVPGWRVCVISFFSSLFFLLIVELIKVVRNKKSRAES